MAGKNNLNISLGVDVSGLKKGFDEAIKVTQKAANTTEKEAAKMTVGVMAAIDKMSTKSQVRQLENLANKLAGMGMEGTQAFQDVIRGAAQLQAQLDDTRGMIAALRPDAPFNALSTTLGASAQAFAGVQGAMALFGGESEDVEKILLKVQSAMALAEGAKSIDGLIDGFTQLKAVIMANPILAVASAVIALGAAAVATAASLDDLSAAENAQLEVSKQAAITATEEAAKINVLAQIVDDANLPYARRKEALDLLNQISPETFGNIKLEGLAYGAAGKAAEQYTRTLVEQAKAKASLDLITEARKKQIQLETDAARKLKGDLDFGDYIAIAAGNGHMIYSDLQKDWQKSEDLIKSLEKSILKTATAAENSKKSLSDILDIKSPTKGGGGSNSVAKTETKKQYGDKLYNSRVPAEIEKISKAANDLQLSAPPAVKEVEIAFSNFAESSRHSFLIAQDGMAMYSQELENLKQQLVESGFKTAANGLADALTAGLTGGNVENVLAKTFGSILGLVGDFMIEYGLKTEALALLMSQIQAAIALNPAMALPYAIALVAGGVALKGIAGSFGQQKTNKFADGGVLSSPTMGLMAEYPNAHINKEIVTPENLMAKVVRENSGGGMTGQLVARVSGNDLVFIYDQTKKGRGRG